MMIVAVVVLTSMTDLELTRRDSGLCLPELGRGRKINNSWRKNQGRDKCRREIPFHHHHCAE